MKSKGLAIVLALTAGTAGFVFALHHARGAREDSGPPPTVRLIKNRTAVADVTVTDLDGRTFTLSSLRGKVVLVNHWATWCGPCRAEIPGLVALQDKYRDHLVILGIATDEDSEAGVRAFVKQHRITYPIVMATDDTRRAFPAVAALPTTYVLDREGKTAQKHIGLIDMAVYEDETRTLAGLVDATIEYVDDAPKPLGNAAMATEIPGIDLKALKDDQRKTILARLNGDKCTCGCDLTLAQCRINDSSCNVSLPIAQDIVDAVKAGK
jgi:thiol-disulfide isomerase/thioredoxin